MGLFAEKFSTLPKKWCWDKIQEQRERKQLDTQCTPLCLVFPPGPSRGDTHTGAVVFPEGHRWGIAVCFKYI